MVLFYSTIYHLNVYWQFDTIGKLQYCTVKDIINKYFTGIFMRDILPSKVNIEDCRVSNLDVGKNKGTH